MNKKSFDYKPLACNKNDRNFKWDIKKDAEIPDDAIYIKMGNINDMVVRYVVMWGDDIDIESTNNENSAFEFKSVASL